MKPLADFRIVGAGLTVLGATVKRAGQRSFSLDKSNRFVIRLSAFLILYGMTTGFRWKQTSGGQFPRAHLHLPKRRGKLDANQRTIRQLGMCSVFIGRSEAGGGRGLPEQPDLPIHRLWGDMDTYRPSGQCMDMHCIFG